MTLIIQPWESMLGSREMSNSAKKKRKKGLTQFFASSRGTSMILGVHGLPNLSPIMPTAESACDSSSR